MGRRVIPFITLVLVNHLLITACVGLADAAPDAWTAADSAGIRIVENYRPQWTSGTGWTVSPTPAFSVNDELDDPNPLVRPVDAIRLHDGRIAVADRTAGVIALYDSTGRRLPDIGRKGSGPGEFQGLRSLDRWIGDSIIAYDLGLQRYTVFDARGKLGRSYQLIPPRNAPGASIVGLFADGTSLMVTTRFGAGGLREGLARQELPLARGNPDGSDALLLPASIIREELYTESEIEQPPLIDIPVLFAPNQEYTINGNDLVTGTTDEFALSFIGSSGSLAQIARIHQESTPATNEHRRLEEEMLLGVSDLQRIHRSIRRAVPQMPRYDHLPAFGRWASEYPYRSTTPSLQTLLGDSEENTWIISYAPPGVPTLRPWIVISPEGRWLGRVTLPPGFEPFDIGNDYVLGWRRDQNDLIRIELYDLHKAVT